jgi:hypothetical protein
MGRVGRYKKIKSFDPFSRSQGVVKEPESTAKANAAPTKSERNYVPSKLRRIMSLQRGAAGAQPGGRGQEKVRRSDGSERRQVHGASAPSGVDAAAFAHIHALPGESTKFYAGRVNAELRRLKESGRAAAVAAKPISKKRKAYLSANEERKKSKAGHMAQRRADADAEQFGEGVDEDAEGADAPERALLGGGRKRQRAPEAGDFPTAERVAFGERVEAPPRLQAVPRPNKAQRMQATIARIQSGAPAPVAKRLKPADGSALGADLDRTEQADAVAESARAAAVRAATVEVERDRARKAYAEMKARRQEAFVAAARAAAANKGKKGKGGALKLGGGGGAMDD